MTDMSLSRYVATDGTATLAVTGEIDLTTADALAGAIRDVVTATNATDLVIDLDEVTFLDSAGIRTLIVGHKLAVSHGVVLVVTNPRGEVRKVMEITGTLTFLSQRP